MPEIRRWKCRCCQALKNTNIVTLGGLIHLSGFFFTSQEKHRPIPPILLTAEAVWTHVETTGLIYCSVLAVVSKHRDWLSDRYPWIAPFTRLAYLFNPFCFLTLLFAALVASAAPVSSQIKNLLIITCLISHSFATFIHKLGVLQGNVTCERCKQLHSDFPPLPAPSWPLKTVQHVHSKALKSNNARRTSSQCR